MSRQFALPAQDLPVQRLKPWRRKHIYVAVRGQDLCLTR